MSLLKRLSESPDERPDAVRVSGTALSGVELLRCATAVADRVHGLDRVAIEATPTMETVVGVVGALLAGVAVVPVPADAGAMERAHMFRDSGAAALLAPKGPGRPRVPGRRSYRWIWPSGRTGPVRSRIRSGPR
ncbi:hypothetical protein Prubr_08750 [Polymorphospora rubra]|uniref:AMP-dependent synthetase/ligase domain-containing protein n=1 Tax=Polymorphospora rubra TaxID=338584 RepID=A0A810MTA0_9ACTN|nr:hypothetical protein Prubr_08750 [Polymorphospora rubra]